MELRLSPPTLKNRPELHIVIYRYSLSAQHTSISVLDTTRVSIFLILTYAACVICKRNSDVTVMQQLCHNSITVMSL